MATTVGTETDVNSLLSNLMQLEHDAIAAYETTIELLSDADSRRMIGNFLDDHRQHVAALREHSTANGIALPEGGDMKQFLTTGKVTLAALGGDDMILRAMKTNEDDTVQAYQQAVDNRLSDGDLRTTFEKALSDERRHREWMESRAH